MQGRFGLVWLGALSLSMAGCFDPEDNPPGDESSSTDGTSTAPSTSGSPTTNSGPTTTTTTTTAGTTDPSSSSSSPSTTDNPTSTTTSPTSSSSSDTTASTTELVEPECGDDSIDPGEVCFSAAVTIMVGPTPVGIATERINGDAFDDFAVALSSGTLLTFLGDGTGAFGDPLMLADPDPQGWSQLELGAIADANVDAIVGEPGNVNVMRFRGFGDGTYSNAVNLGAGGGDMHMVDIDGDDILDLAVGVEFGVRIYLGAADESFTSADTAEGDGAPNGFAVVDIDGDTELDIIASTGTNTAAVIRGNGDGTFAAATMLTTIGPLEVLVSGDFDGDGSADFAGTSGNEIAIHYGNGDGSFLAPITLTAAGAVGAMAAADIDGDGNDDLFSAESNVVEVFLGAGDQTFADPVSVPTGTFAEFIELADFNDDGAIDILVDDAGDVSVAVVLSNP